MYVGWNDSRPFQRASPGGSGGAEDYSTWNFTYTPLYHEIANRTNLLSSELTCSEIVPNNVAAHSINITGMSSSIITNATDIAYSSSAGPSVDLSGETSFQGSDQYTTAEDPLTYDSSGISYSYDDTTASNSDNTDSSGDDDESGTG